MENAAVMASNWAHCHSYLTSFTHLCAHAHTHIFIRIGRGLQLDIEHLKPSWLPCHAVGVPAECVCVCVFMRGRCQSGHWTSSLLPHFSRCHRLFHGPPSAICTWACMRDLPLRVICHAFGKRSCVSAPVFVYTCVCVCVCAYAYVCTIAEALMGP